MLVMKIISDPDTITSRTMLSEKSLESINSQGSFIQSQSHTSNNFKEVAEESVFMKRYYN